MTNAPLIKLIPQHLEKIWAGSRLSAWYHHTSTLPIGEVWCVSTLDAHPSLLSGTDLILRDVLKANPDRFPLPNGELPYRITLIDAAQPLSVQIHPDQAYADRMGLESGLSEAWVVLKTTGPAELVLGHHAASSDDLHQEINDGHWDRLLHRVKSMPLHWVFIPGAMLHAIGAGNLIYEISERPDVTYRLYDYDRLDVSTGKPRPLHRKEALSLIQVPQINPPQLHPFPETSDNPQVLLERPGKFGIKKVDSAPTLNLETWGFLTVLGGKGTLSGTPIALGDTVLVGRDQVQCSCSGSWWGLYAYLPEES